MTTDILITKKRDLSVKREIGFVSVMEATEQTVAIAKLREKAIERRSGKGLFALFDAPERDIHDDDPSSDNEHKLQYRIQKSEIT